MDHYATNYPQNGECKISTQGSRDATSVAAPSEELAVKRVAAVATGSGPASSAEAERPHRWCVHGLRDDRLCVTCPPWRRMWDRDADATTVRQPDPNAAIRHAAPDSSQLKP